MMTSKPLVTNEDIETAVGAVGRSIAVAPRFLLWVAGVVFLCAEVGPLVTGAIAGGIAAMWMLLYANPTTKAAARWAWCNLGPLADLLAVRVSWKPGSKPDRAARRRGAAMVRKLASAARDAEQSTRHTNPNGSVRYTDPRGLRLEVIPLGVRFVARPTQRHTAEALAKLQDRFASRLGVATPERLVSTVLDQKHVAFDWEYLDPYAGVRLSAGLDDDGPRADQRAA